MKKALKKFGLHKFICAIAVTLSAVLLAVSFAGCVKEKTFEKAGMSITLTSAFTEKDIVSQTAYYESRNAIVTALKEEFSLSSGFGLYSVSTYTDLVMRNNKITAEKHEREGKDYFYFTYEKTVSGKDFYYLATTHKAEDAFWLIQFACVQDQKDKYTETFLGWADTVIFNSSTAA